MDQRGSALKRRAPDSGFAPNPRFSGAQRLVGKVLSPLSIHFLSSNVMSCRS